ncbi:DUF1801 domain-containing protein [Microbacterium pseudoresistens]|uniref:Uncharacterized protein YdhG (YjbR/CyaY superfamily) n=1 Tax=Microbacterium pseudoresistens TaxID=640634 RepID=A0A7Y9JNU2_9MICO|nr:hypothetical protein [Microbacterium pseudoresistens]NYD54039.1 uncharacterized protein YdhG (YjbR/CyaY superfamily) [Microbacterium pseudoresistens]
MAEKTETFSAEERAAMKDRVKESRSRSSAKKKDPETARRDGDAEIAEKLAALSDEERALGEALRTMVSESAPHLMPRTYYGMPAWANEAGKVVCFFKPKSKFKVRYSTFEFEAPATLDEGNVWPTAYAVTALDKADLAFLAERVRRAAGTDG